MACLWDYTFFPIPNYSQFTDIHFRTMRFNYEIDLEIT